VEDEAPLSRAAVHERARVAVESVAWCRGGSAVGRLARADAAVARGAARRQAVHEDRRRAALERVGRRQLQQRVVVADEGVLL